MFEGTDDSRRDEEYFDEENYDESSYEAASTNNDAYIEGFADEQNEGYTQEQYYQDDQETYDQRSCEDGEVFDNQDPEEKVDDSEFDERSGEAGFSSNKPQAKGPHTEGEGNESNNLTGLSAPDLLDDDELLEEDEDVEAVEQEVESVDPTGCTTPQKRLREPEDSDHLSDDHDQG